VTGVGWCCREKKKVVEEVEVMLTCACGDVARVQQTQGEGVHDLPFAPCDLRVACEMLRCSQERVIQSKMTAEECSNRKSLD
jgi:hypothetical protein